MHDGRSLAPVARAGGGGRATRAGVVVARWRPAPSGRPSPRRGASRDDRAGDPAGERAPIGRTTLPARHADQLRRLPGRPQAGRHRDRRDQRLPGTSRDCFVWVALRDATDAELDTMQREFGLHDLAVEDARHGHQRPKIEEYGKTLFVVHAHCRARRGRRAAASARSTSSSGRISCSRCATAASSSFLGVRERASASRELLRNGAGFVLYALMDAVVDRYFPIIDALETELEDIEAQIFERGAARSNIEQLYALKQRVTTLQATRWRRCSRSAGKLHGGRVPTVCEGNAASTSATCYDHLARINASHRHDPRHHRHRDPGQPVDGDDRGVRDHQAPGGLGRHLRGGHRVRRHLGHELRAHARAEVGLRLSGRRWRVIGGACRLLYWRFRRAGWL